jgi:3-hydroxyisobutyrate dehydrogenase-like beta-hydroxyacid dehydrogenase
MPTIALISPGAMGSAIGARLTRHGAQVITQLEGRSSDSFARAREAGMVGAGPAELAHADLFLSIVPPHTAEDVARAFAASAAGIDKPALYVDCNACSPETKRAIAQIVAAASARMVDACIIGGPHDEGGPSFYASGPHAAEAALLADHGLRWHHLDAPIGAAAALKMCFAGINKGLYALGNMMRLAAAQAGVGDALAFELERRVPHVHRQLDKGTPSIFPRAWRWAPEMREIAEFGAAEPGAAEVFEGFALFYERLAVDLSGERKDFATLASRDSSPPGG